MMLLGVNPNQDGIKRIIDNSAHKAAKWLKDLDSGDIYYWPAEESTHANVAKLMHVDKYDKGLAVSEGTDLP